MSWCVMSHAYSDQILLTCLDTSALGPHFEQLFLALRSIPHVHDVLWNFQLPRVRFWLDYPLDFVHLNSAHGCNMKDCRLIRITTIIPCNSFTSPIRQVGRWRQKRPWERTRRSLGWMDPLDARCKINSKDHWAISKAVEEPNQSPKPEGVGSWKWLLSMELGKNGYRNNYTQQPCERSKND